MQRPILIGLGLGLVAAVAFVSATTGPLIARFLLFFLTPLPLALAGLGWGWRIAAVGGAAATGLIALAGGPLIALLFAVSQALPVTLLTYLALLSRTAAPAPGAPEVTEWYPPGRLVIWAAGFAALLATGSLLLIGGDLDDLRKELADFIDRIVKGGLLQLPGGTPLSDVEVRSLAEVTLAVLPAASAVSWMASLLFNLWLAGRVTLASGQLGRPWPDLAALDYPPGTALVFGVALLATTLGGFVGLAASSVGGVLFLAYVLAGLAIVHYTTRGQSWRPFALWALYAALFLINIWIGLVIAVLGLAEPMLQLRRRYPPPPGPPPSSIAS